MAGHGEVWVFIEQHSGAIAEVSLELLSKARELADQLGVEVGAVLLGEDTSDAAQTISDYEADKVYLAEDKRLGTYTTLSYAKVICELVEQYRPEIVLYGATPLGRDLAPRIASQLRVGLTADCTDLRIGDFEDKAKNAFYRNVLYQIRPAFGGNFIGTIVSPEHRPQMATVREGVMRLAKRPGRPRPEVIRVPVRVGDVEAAVEVVECMLRLKTVDLKSARIIVSGGAGVGSREGFEVIRELAEVLGGAVGASRAAVDAGYIGKEHQVGQTGTTVRPALYVACGISGTVQHRAGMQESGRIIAINTDPNAPMLGIAHYAIVGDLHQVIPMMIRAYKEK